MRLATKSWIDARSAAPLATACTIVCTAAPHTAEELERELPKWFVEEARASGPSNTFYSTGIFPHPADLWPLPALDQSVMAAEGRGSRDGGEYDEGGLGSRTGAIFIDGTCTSSPIRGIARAAGAAVEINERGESIREVCMLVPAAVAQTAQAGEHGGLLLAIGQLLAPTDIFTDCLGVHKAFLGDPIRATNAKRVHGATMLFMSADPQKRARVRSLQWVKAHRGVGTATDGRDEWLIKGNAEADLAAKRAVRAHPQPSQEAVAELEFYSLRFPLGSKAIVVALARLPPGPGNMSRRPLPQSQGDARRRGCHAWEWDDDRWRCLDCWSWCRRRRLPAYRRRQRCPGGRDSQEAREYMANGHRIRAALASPPFLFCVRCGGASLRRAYKLKRPCAGPNASGRQALIRIAKGLHPWQERDGRTGKEIRRTRLEGERVFDMDTGDWFGMVNGKLVRHRSGRGLKRNIVGVQVKLKARAAARQHLSTPRYDDNATVDHGRLDEAVERDFELVTDFEEQDIFGHGGPLP